MGEQPSVLIIMPAHNEAGNIRRTLAEIRESLAWSADILVVNDRSSDETGALARECGATVVDLPCNLGYGGAVQTGFKYAIRRGYDIAVLMDADGQHDPRCIPDLLAPVISGQADIAIGSRFLGQLAYRIPATRRLGMAVMAKITSQACGQRITDPTSGFQALRQDVMRFFSQDNYPMDFPDADTIMTLKFHGFRIQEVPVTMRARFTGTSMHAGLRLLYYIPKMLLAMFVVVLRHATAPAAPRGDETGPVADRQASDPI